MKISYLDKVMYAGNTSRWLMGQLLHTEKTEPFVGYKGKGLEWGKIDQNVVNDIDFLELHPDDKSTFEIPECVSRLPNLKALEIPSWFVPHLKENSFPNSVESLHIGVRSEKKPKVNWDKNQQFLSVKSLYFNCEATSDFWANCFPYLDMTLAFTMGHKNLNVGELGKLVKLKNLFLNNCENVETLNALNSLGIGFFKLSFSKNQDFTGLSSFKNITEMEIRGCRKLVSLAGLENLKQLETLEIMHCPHLEDLGNLADIKTLNYLLVMSCGKNWTKHIETIKSKFRNAGFQEIRFEPDGNYSLLEVVRD